MGYKERIAELYFEGYKAEEIAEKCGVGADTIYNILSEQGLYYLS